MKKKKELLLTLLACIGLSGSAYEVNILKNSEIDNLLKALLGKKANYVLNEINNDKKLPEIIKAINDRKEMLDKTENPIACYPFGKKTNIS